MKQRSREKTMQSEEIHYSRFGEDSPCGIEVLITAYVKWSPERGEVTCEACLDGKPAESREDRRGALLAEAKAAEAKALQELAGWSRILADAVSLRERLETPARPLCGLVSQDQGSGVGTATIVTPEGLRRVQVPFVSPVDLLAFLPEYAAQQTGVAQYGAKPHPY